MEQAKFETIDQGMTALTEKKALRDKMGGAMWWNVLNDECLKLADDITALARVQGAYTETRQRIIDLFDGELA